MPQTHSYTHAALSEFSFMIGVSDVDGCCSLWKCGQNVVAGVVSRNPLAHMVWCFLFHVKFFQKSKGIPFPFLHFREGEEQDGSINYLSFCLYNSLRGHEVHFQWGPSAARHSVHELVQTHLSQVARTWVSTSLCLIRNWPVLNMGF